SDPNNTIVTVLGNDVETQQMVSFTESLTNFPGFNNELILVRSTLGPGETTADWSWFHSSQGLALDLVNHSLIQQNIDPESDGWRFLVPSPIDDLVIVLHAGFNRSKSRDAFVVRGTLGLSQVEFLNSTLFVYIDPFEAAIESTLFKQIGSSQVYIYRGSPDGQSRVVFKIDFSDGTFLMTGKYIDLTGLDFPIRVEIAAGNYFGSGDAQIKKGKPLPMIFRMGVKDSLRVERFKYLKTDRPNSFTNRSLTVSGSIATKAFPFDLTSKAIIVNWGTKTMTIPGFSGFLGILRQGEKERFVYKRFPGVSNPIASAIFDFDRARFKIVINKTNLNDPTQSFKVSFDTVNNETFDQTVTSVGIGRLPAESED
ncbi:MAG: hypothetical protein IID32_12065, partial [Planctomycetes bacterium]|nr:hypothetical protein [Planctomycetota bacterium]